MSVYQNMNQIEQTAIKGSIAAIVNPVTLSAQVDPASVDTIVAGDAVKLSTAVGNTILVDKCAATDAPIGYVIYNPKKDSFIAGNALEIALPSSIIYLESSGTVTRGDEVEFVVSGSKVMTSAGVNPISGTALDTATNGLVRVLVKTQIALVATITGSTINSTPIGGTTPAAGAFTTLSATGAASVKTLGTTKKVLTSSATIGLVGTDGDIQTLVPAHTATINATGLVTGQKLVLVITTSGTDSFTLTFGTAFKTVGTLATGTASAKVFVIEFICDGTNYNEVARTTAM